MSGLYTAFKNDLMKANINLETVNVSAALIDDASYTFADTHLTLDDIPPTAIVGTPLQLTNTSVVEDRFVADDLLFTNVNGNTIEGVLFYIDTGVPSTSRLMLYANNDGTFSATPAGVNINIIFNSNPPGIFRL